MGRRSWTHHLRLLPGGDSDVASGIVATALLYLGLLVVGLIGSALAVRSLGGFSFGPLRLFSLANAFPCLVIAGWTGWRIQRTKHIEEDQVAVDLERRRVYFGDEVGRVPKGAVVFSVTPRQVRVALADGRPATVYYRVNADPDDLLVLGRTLRRHAGLATEDYVHSVVSRLAGEILPDPQGLRDAAGRELLAKGIVVTRVSVD
ncbi:MAG: hypothetical protein D6731_04975 [Planctomycetota bacterium]|nr:MAG: hypothetical protein D6731_04975 [Planctomycetota bacterium]